MILVFGRFLWQPHKRTYDKISAEPHNKCWRSGSQSGQNYFGLWAQHQWAGGWMPPLHMKLIRQKCHYWKCREVDCHFCRITQISQTMTSVSMFTAETGSSLGTPWSSSWPTWLSPSTRPGMIIPHLPLNEIHLELVDNWRMVYVPFLTD